MDPTPRSRCAWASSAAYITISTQVASKTFYNVNFANTPGRTALHNIKTAAEAGIKFPVFLTRTVYDAFVTVPPGVTAQDEAGRLWDIVWMLRFAILRARPGVDRVPVALYVRNDQHRAKLVKLVATVGPLDIDDPAPAITVMMPDED